MAEVCYFCGNPASSREHVPPKGLFPKSKDSPDGKDYRNNLLTVPSCAIHNTGKSKDDEYLLYFLSMNLVSNPVGQRQLRTKVERARQRKPLLMDRFLLEHKRVWVQEFEDEPLQETMAIPIDIQRLINQFEHIARGVYFLEKRKIWPRKLRIRDEFTLDLHDSDSNKCLEKMVKIANDIFRGIEEKGDNPEIFRYQIAEREEQIIMRLHFYGDSKVLVYFE